MSLSPSLTTGSGTSGGGIAATRLGFGGEKRLKSPEADGSALDENNCLKTGKADRLKLGRETMVAPMTVSAASETAMTGTRFEATSGGASGTASGRLGPYTSPFGTSVTCVPLLLRPAAGSLPSPVNTTKHPVSVAKGAADAGCSPEFPAQIMGRYG